MSDLKLAPFHLLATEGQVEIQRDHVWQMEKLAEICKASDGSLGGRGNHRGHTHQVGPVPQVRRSSS